MKKVTLICVSLIASLLIWGCKDSASTNPTQNCTPADGKVAEMTTPVAGKTFKVGDTVNVEYKVDASQLKQTHMTIISVSVDNGMSWSSIAKGTSVSESNGQYQCLSCKWILGSENDMVDYQSVNENCKLRICEYSNESNKVVSDKFTITK